MGLTRRLEREIVSDDLLLPDNAVLVHIGPYKTGTTAIQSSLHQHRDDLAAAGVWYPGPGARQAREGWSLLGRSMRGALPVDPAVWERLAAQVRERSDQRVCISTEDLVSANKKNIAKLVEDLGRDRVHMVMVARRLDKLIPSAWQQRVKSSYETRTYDEFVSQVLAPTRKGDAARTFWHNHGITRVLNRWTAELPADQITILVADESDRQQLPRTFERLLGLPSGLLTPGVQDNTSLTLPRVEFYRRLNEIFTEHAWDDRTRRQWLHVGLLPGLMSAVADGEEQRIPPLPPSAHDRLVDLGENRADAVRTSGMRVIGDPDTLHFDPTSVRADERAMPSTMTIESAARAVEALMLTTLARQAEAAAATDKVRAKLKRAKAASAPSAPSLDGVSSRTMLREMARRQRNKLRRH